MEDVKYDVVLLEKPIDKGLTKSDVNTMLDMLSEEESIPFEVNNPNGSSSAMGFIGIDAADRLANSVSYGLPEFLEGVLDDMEKESPNNQYVYTIRNWKWEQVTASVWMGRNLPKREEDT